MKNNYNTKNWLYKLLSSTKQVLFALALSVFSGTAYSQTTYTFNYTGGIQTMNLQPGTYDIEMWGAIGETAVGHPAGGIGGYSAGTYSVSSPITIYIAVGGKGSLGASSAAFANGGWNGGGNGYGSTVIGAGGGGASHIATATGVLSALASNTSAVIIVAGGGGGSGYNGAGGNGGGAVGGNGNTGLGGSTGSPFGAGAIGTTAGTCGGGGGGWFGGNLGSPGNTGGAGGGSGYIGGVTSGTTAQTGQPGFVAKPVATGNGLVLIKEICNITLNSSTSGTAAVVPICSGTTLTLTSNAISNYSWSTGSTASSLVVSPTTNTVYALTATSPSNCTAARQLTVLVNSAAPVLAINSSTTQVCLGKTVTLTASGAVTYTWAGGSPTPTNGVSFMPGTTAVYTVSGENGCGISTATTGITVAPLPVTAASNPATVCAGNASSASITAVANSFTWQPQNQVTTNSVFVVNPLVTTVYTIAASDGTCAGIINLTVMANPVPTINSTATSTMLCPGQSTTLTATGGINYTWSPVGTVASSIVVSPTASILYSAVGDNTFGCLGNTSQGIVVGAQPTLVVNTNSVAICAGAVSNITVTGADTYQWSGGPTTSTYAVSPTQNTIYTVTGTLTSSGCAATETIAISVFAPSVTIAGTSFVCEGLGIALTASAPGAGNYTWSPGGGLFASITVTPASNTTYTASTVSSSLGLNCPISGTLMVTVVPNPTVIASVTPSVICRNETATLSAQGASTYIWSNSSSTLSAAATMTATSSNITILSYTVSGIAANGCENSYPVSITVNACNSIDEINGTRSAVLVYPNPNNGDFKIQSTSAMDLNLVNELGQLVSLIKLTEQNGFKASVSGLAGGIYFIRGENVNKKIVITE